jgi:hypothetical protein
VCYNGRMTTYDSVEEAHIAELKRQNAALLEQVKQLSAIVTRVPSIIMNARLDQRKGEPTEYDYVAHHIALAVR